MQILPGGCRVVATATIGLFALAAPPVLADGLVFADGTTYGERAAGGLDFDSRLRFSFEARGETDGGLRFGGRIRLQYDDDGVEAETLSAAYIYAEASGFAVGVAEVGFQAGLGFEHSEFDTQTYFDGGVTLTSQDRYMLIFGAPQPAIDIIVNPEPFVVNQAVLNAGQGLFFASVLGTSLRGLDEPVPGAAFYVTLGNLTAGLSYHAFEEPDDPGISAALLYAGEFSGVRMAVGVENGAYLESPALRATISGRPSDRFSYLLHGYHEVFYDAAYTGIYTQGAYHLNDRLQGGVSVLSETTPFDDRITFGLFAHYYIFGPAAGIGSLPEARGGLTFGVAQTPEDEVLASIRATFTF